MDARTIQLRDNRRLGYAEYGNPDGVPVLLFHGTPGSRLLSDADADDATQLGIWLIVPERPGFGVSDFQPDREILDWSDDVVELADQRGINKFGVFGVSGGGPYAVACAYKIPERLTQVAILSSPAPFNALGEPAELPTLVDIEDFSNNFAKQILEKPEDFFEEMSANSPEADRESLRLPYVKDFFLATATEAFRNGNQGFIHETLLLATRSWRFPLETIKSDVQIWHGDVDKSVPVECAYFLSEHIPGCQLHILSGKGHIIVGAIGEILKVFL